MSDVDLSVLPEEAQNELIDFYEFLVSKYARKEKVNKNDSVNSDFRTVFRQFLKKVEQDTIDINTNIFDANRE